MQITRKKLGAYIAIVLLLGAVTGAIAQYIITRNVTITGKVLGYGAIQVYSDAGYSIPLISLSFGDLLKETPVTSPKFWVLDIGETPLSVKWETSGLPTGMNLSLTSLGNPWPQGTAIIITTNPANKYIECTATCLASNSTAIGNFAFTLAFVATDNS